MSKRRELDCHECFWGEVDGTQCSDECQYVKIALDGSAPQYG